MLQVRRACGDDFDQVVALQSENLVTQLPPEARQDGFLSVAFTVEQFAQFDADVAVIVGAHQSQVVAYLVTSTPQANLQYPLPAAMIARYSQAVIAGRSLDSFRSLVAGPICVKKSHRGQGIFERLYASLPELLPPGYELVVALVATGNPRSIQAHKKVGMQAVDQFTFAEREFITLARQLEQSQV